MDIIKRYTYFDIGDIPITKTQYSTSSRNWVQWSCIVTRNTCSYCAGLQGHILSPNDSTIVWPLFTQIADAKLSLSLHSLRELQQKTGKTE